MEGLDVIITAGANQAFLNVAMAVCDVNDDVVIVAPYYFSHKMSVQLAGGKVTECPFNPATLLPDWDQLDALVTELKPAMVSCGNVFDKCSK